MAKPSNWNATFCGGQPTWANACVGENGNPGYLEYADGFSTAANNLLDHVLNNEDRKNVDVLVYPICFNIRHAVELRLKHSILKLKNLYDIKEIAKSFDLVKIHDIGNLWETIVKSTQELDSRFIIATEKIEEYIKDINQIDPTGQTFRYPYSNEEIKHLTSESIINLFLIRDRFLKLSKYLSQFIIFIDDVSEEYSHGIFTKQLSREQLLEIAKILPPYENWGDDIFTKSKEEIKYKYSLSSRNYSDAINKIKNHKELSHYIKYKKCTLPLSIEKITSFLDFWIQVNPFDTRKSSKESRIITPNSEFIKEMLENEAKEEIVFNDYWTKHGINLSIPEASYLISFYENRSTNYCEYFYRILNSNIENYTKNNDQIKNKLRSLFRKQLLEFFIKNLLLIKENEIAKKIIDDYDTLKENDYLEHFERSDNVPNVQAYHKQKFDSI